LILRTVGRTTLKLELLRQPALSCGRASRRGDVHCDGRIEGRLPFGSRTRTVSFSAQLIEPRTRLPLTTIENAAAVEVRFIGTVKRTETTWWGR